MFFKLQKIYRNKFQTLFGQSVKNSIQKGYTMIELLIVIVSIGLLFSLGYAGYRQYARRQAVESFARQIKADLRYAEELAASGKKPTGCSSLGGYEFNIQEPLQQYQVNAYCDGSAFGTPEKTESVPSGLVVRASGGAGDSVFFNILSRGTNIPAGSPLIIQVGQTAQLTGVCATTPWDATCTYLNTVGVNVTSTGEIY